MESQEEYSARVRKFREKWKREEAERLSAMSEEERAAHDRHVNAWRAYIEKFGDIPYDMEVTEEELEEAVRTNRPFSEWDKYKGMYNQKIPHGWIL